MHPLPSEGEGWGEGDRQVKEDVLAEKIVMRAGISNNQLLNNISTGP